MLDVQKMYESRAVPPSKIKKLENTTARQITFGRAIPHTISDMAFCHESVQDIIKVESSPGSSQLGTL